MSSKPEEWHRGPYGWERHPEPGTLIIILRRQGSVYPIHCVVYGPTKSVQLDTSESGSITEVKTKADKHWELARDSLMEEVFRVPVPESLGPRPGRPVLPPARGHAGEDGA